MAMGLTGFGVWGGFRAAAKSVEAGDRIGEP
jgi:hypothetical protein